MKLVDLHTHTTASDGLHRPADNVRMAREAGLHAVGITDHDTVAGIDEAEIAGEELGVEVVPGVEISTAEDGKDIHILGYYIDRRNPALLERLASQRQVRNVRNEGIIANLNRLGIPITMAEVERVAGRSGDGDETVGRPHIAEALVRRGAVSSVQEAFDKYLAKGKPAYFNPPRISPFEAIQWIHEAGGKAVVAHPGLYGRDELVERLLDAGADGVEAYHSDHSPEQAEHYRRMAEARGKLVTAGSDFHGERKGGGVYHGPIGNRTVDAGILEQLRR